MNQNRGIREGEQSHFQLFACLQRSTGPGKAGPKLCERVGFEFYAHVCEAASVDSFEDRRGGADDTGEAILDVGIGISARDDYECHRAQAREPRD